MEACGTGATSKAVRDSKGGRVGRCHVTLRYLTVFDHAASNVARVGVEC